MFAARLYERKAGFIAGFLIACAPFAVRYSQELRSYALLMFLVTLSSFFFVRAIETRATVWFVVYAIAAAASCYADLYGGLVILAEASSLFVLGRRSIPIRQLLTTAVAIGVLLLPLGYFVTSAQQEAGAGGRPTVSSTLSVLSNVGGGKLLAIVLAGLCAATAWMAARTWTRYRSSLEAWRAGFVPLWIVVPFVLAFGLAFIRDRTGNLAISS